MPTAPKKAALRPNPAARKSASSKAAARSSGSLVPGLSLDKGIQALARDLRSWTGFVLGLTGSAASGAVGAAADLSFKLVKSRLPVA